MKWRGQGLRDRTGTIRRNVHALYLAVRHPDVPWLAKLVVGLVVAYALSPIDLIPDFIPILGWLDDLLLIPLGLWLAIRLIPPDIWRACQAQAGQDRRDLRKSIAAAVVIVILWLCLLVLLVWLAVG